MLGSHEQDTIPGLKELRAARKKPENQHLCYTERGSIWGMKNRVLWEQIEKYLTESLRGYSDRFPNCINQDLYCYLVKTTPKCLWFNTINIFCSARADFLVLSSKGVSGSQAVSMLWLHKLRASRLPLHPAGIEGRDGVGWEWWCVREKHISYLTTYGWKTHITFIYTPVARTSHMALPRWKRDGSGRFPAPKKENEMIWWTHRIVSATQKRWFLS